MNSFGRFAKWISASIMLPHHGIISSHTVANALTQGDTHLDDMQLRCLARREAVIGVMLYNRFLDANWSPENQTRVTLAGQFYDHLSHIASIVGWNNVAIGSDLDAGGGALFYPVEINCASDIRRFASFSPRQLQSRYRFETLYDFFIDKLP